MSGSAFDFSGLLELLTLGELRSNRLFQPLTAEWHFIASARICSLQKVIANSPGSDMEASCASVGTFQDRNSDGLAGLTISG